MWLNKFLALAGVASRRASDELISRGQVTVNNQVVAELGIQIDPDQDKIAVDGRLVTINSEKVIYLLNKPLGVVTTASDPDGRKTVLDFVPKTPRVFPCGRLDKETTGLVILTNDGELCYQLTHPKFEVKKEYLLTGHCSNPQLAVKKLQSGVKLSDGPAQADAVTILKASGDQIKLLLTIHDGRNRIVRRMAETAGIDLMTLTRTHHGQFELGDLPAGQFKQVVV